MLANLDSKEQALHGDIGRDEFVADSGKEPKSELYNDQCGKPGGYPQATYRRRLEYRERGRDLLAEGSPQASVKTDFSRMPYSGHLGERGLN